MKKKKYRGKISISFEALKEILRLPDDVNIISAGQFKDDTLRENFTVIVQSDKCTDYTYECQEGSLPYPVKNINSGDFSYE